MWSVSVSGGNGSGDMARPPQGKAPYGGGYHVCGAPFEGTNDGGRGGVTGPNGKDRYMWEWFPCEAQKTYKMNGKMDVTVDLSTNHGGYFEFAICNDETRLGGPNPQSCFDENKLTKTVKGCVCCLIESID